MQIDRFDRETIDKYLVVAKKQYPDVDVHLLEYAIADYLIYYVEKNERPTEDHEDFIKANKTVEELIEQKRILDKEI